MNNPIPILLLISLLLSITACNSKVDPNALTPSSPQSHDSDSLRLNALNRIRRTLARQERAGMSGVVRLQWGDALLIHEAYGWQDREAARLMTIDVGFDIGSIVKVMTAATVFQLEQEGILHTTDTVSQFFPGAPSDIGAITLDQLLDHTSGLPEYLGDDDELLNRNEARDRIFQSSLQFSPGTQDAYSNSGYTLLALIIEQASGLSYEQAVRDRVFIPADTPEIGYQLAGWTQDNLAVGYRRRRRWGTPLDQAWLSDGPSWTLRGNGGMIATADELARWFDAVFTDQVLDAAALSKLAEQYTFTDTNGLRIGEAGGNDVFNALHENWVDVDIHLTVVTSTASRPAEQVWRKLRKDMLTLIQSATPNPLIPESPITHGPTPHHLVRDSGQQHLKE